MTAALYMESAIKKWIRVQPWAARNFYVKNRTNEESTMHIFELILLGVGLSMDAFAVSICKGLAMEKVTLKKAGLVGLWFGGFQALMPLIGFFLGRQFAGAIAAFDHWVAFGLLGLIGINMIREALSPKEEDEATDDLSFKTMFLLAVATSIDALAVGVSLSLAGGVNIWMAITIIGCTTFLLSAIGVKAGGVFGARFEKKAELAGGIILICLGLKILLEHLGIFG